MTKILRVTLPKETIQRMHEISRQQPMYENPQDVALFAITKLLEQYRS